MRISDEILDLTGFITEHSNITSSEFLSMNEAAQLAVSDKTMDVLVNTMSTKYASIDFGDIPKSRGDVTRFKHYKMMRQCIHELREIHFADVEKGGGKIGSILVIEEALDNVEKFKKDFQFCFAKEQSYGIILYNSIVLAIFDAVTLLVSRVMEMAIIEKETVSLMIPDNFDETSRQHLLIRTLMDFNKGCRDGEIKKFLSLSNDEILSESAAVLGTVLFTIWISAKVIPSLIKQLIYYYYSAKQNISDGLAIQAKFLQLNIQRLEAEGYDSTVVAKQTKLAGVLYKLSQVFSVKADDTGARKELEKAKVNYTMDDVNDYINQDEEYSL